MTSSLLKLIATSVLACWAIGFGVLILYANSRSWTEPDAKRNGVMLAYQMLDDVPADERPVVLETLSEHFEVPLAIVPLSQVAPLTERPPIAGHTYFDRREPRAQRLYVPFRDSSAALAAGPINPAAPEGYFPLGVVLAIIFTPLVASLVALRLAKQLQKVEYASAALASGNLAVRVDNPAGPSHELAASFNAMAERVERLVRDREELVQAISHELGSPLSRLQFQLELLGGDVDSGERQRRIDRMMQDLDELEELVAELLGWVQSDKAALECRLFDPVKALMDLAALAEFHVEGSKNVGVYASLPETTQVYADQRLFQRAIENLLRNAVRYAQSMVSLSVVQVGGDLKVIVDDDGPGIPAESRERVLKPFVRLHDDRGRDTGGAGLGLAIVNRIVESHGGTITISEAPGGGARFTTTWSTDQPPSRTPTGQAT